MLSPWDKDTLEHGDAEDVAEWVSDGGDPNDYDEHGWSALEFVCDGYYEAMDDKVRLLLEAGADPNEGHGGMTPLAWACRHLVDWDNSEGVCEEQAVPVRQAIKLLLEAGASIGDISPWCCDGESPLSCAVIAQASWLVSACLRSLSSEEWRDPELALGRAISLAKGRTRRRLRKAANDVLGHIPEYE